MNPNLRDIVEFTGEPEVLSLVSRDWRQEILDNERNIVESLQQQYPNINLEDMGLFIIEDNNIEAMQRLLLVRIDIDWNEYAYLLIKYASREMVSLIAPYLNDINRVLIAGRRGVVLDRYPSLLDTHIRVPIDIQGTTEGELYAAILLGDEDLFTRLLKVPSEYCDTEYVLKKFLFENGIIPPRIMNVLISEFVHRYAAEHPLTYTVGRARDLYLSKKNPITLINDDLSFGIPVENMEWIPYYLSIILVNDNVKLFQQLYDAVGSIHEMGFAFMGGPSILDFVITKPNILRVIPGFVAADSRYQHLDIEYFIRFINRPPYSRFDWARRVSKEEMPSKYRNSIAYINDVIVKYHLLAKKMGLI